MTSTRLIASEIIADVVSCGFSLNQAISRALTPLHLSEKDAAFVKALAFGTLRFYHRLDRIGKQLLKKPLSRRSPLLQALLLCAIYQIDYLNVPDYAVVNETVNAVKQLKAQWACGVMNGCLQRYLRESDKINAHIAHDPVALFSHPAWLINSVRKAWPEHWQSILQQNNQHPIMCLRINLEKISREAYMVMLEKAGIRGPYRIGKYSKQAIILKHPCAASTLPGFSKGWVTVQDQAAQLAAPLLDAMPGHRVLDACSAPGGKATHILQYAPPIASLTVVEKKKERLMSLQNSLQAYDILLDIIHADAAMPEAWWDGRLFDRILLDAPCSGTGVIRRHPDIKLLRRQKDIEQQVSEQHRLLVALWPLLKPGGILLYVTCSVLPCENENQMQRFIATTDDCEERFFKASWGLPRAVGRQTLPQSSLDGFYYARLFKKPVGGM